MNRRTFISILCFVLLLINVFSMTAAAGEADVPVYAPDDGESEIAMTGDPGLTETSGDALQVPQIRVVTEDGNGTELQKADGYVNAQISITDTDGSTLSDAVSFKVRGNTTAMTTVKKKAFTFKFEKKKDVLGMGKGKKWALIASAFDPTLLRNYIAFDIAYELGLEYTSNQKYVEVWVDDSYRGSYILYEPVQEGKDRVDIDIESNDGKKDFLIEYEAQRVEEDVTYFKVDGLRFISSEPEEPDEDQLAYIVDTMTDIVNTLKNGTEQEIREKIDVDSFAKYYMLNEFVKTYDFDMSSVFFYYKDGKLYAGPAWDYDLSAGNENNEKYSTSRFTTSADTKNLFANNKNLYKLICKHDWFMDCAARVYKEHYSFFSNIYTEGGLMDTLFSEYGDLFARNYAPDVWNIRKAWINIQKVPLATYKSNYEFLRNWYKERDEWLTEHYGLESCLLGDADGDGEVNIIDATVISRKAVLVKNIAIDETAADADDDGEVTVVDATLVQRYDAKIDTPYTIGEQTVVFA